MRGSWGLPAAKRDGDISCGEWLDEGIEVRKRRFAARGGRWELPGFVKGLWWRFKS